MNILNGRYLDLLERIRQFEEKYQRPKHSVKLLAVSKKKPIENIRMLYQLGQRDFAENYLQEAMDKIASIDEPDLIWHFIGPVQSNKTRQIAEHFSWVHSIDRIKVARRLAESRPAHLPPLNLCLQLNISNESSKSGVSISDYLDLAAELKELDHVSLRGLMGLPQLTDNVEQQLTQSRLLADCFVNLQDQGYDVDTLSLGTSHDLEAAIAAGSTMVRVGTALFGAREK